MDTAIDSSVAERVTITIAVCTYLRPSLFETLKSFEQLNGINTYSVTVMVIDNDALDILKAPIENFAQNYSFPLVYVHAPEKNISIARNAALENTSTQWLLFIDDDELAEASWLENIMSVRETADVVIGQCKAVYGQNLPGWLKRCDFHSNRLKGPSENAYTSNALINMNFVKKHSFRFRLELGKTGGEDTVFFRQVSEVGGKIHYCPEAIVYEPVTENRANMQWVKTRKFRAGQTHGLLCKDFKPKAYKYLLFSAGSKMIVSAIMTVLSIPSTDTSRQWWARAHLHAGALNYRIRGRIFEEYN